MKKRFTEAQINEFLRGADAGIPVEQHCRKHGFSDATCYLWRSKCGGKIENGRLKTLIADALLENEVAGEVHRKDW